MSASGNFKFCLAVEKPATGGGCAFTLPNFSEKNLRGLTLLGFSPARSPGAANRLAGLGSFFGVRVGAFSSFD